jgi:uncharacterized protein (TIGR02391 family)
MQKISDMNLLEQLNNFRRQRGEKAPFESLLDFEEWADSVHPLLSFHDKYANNFSKTVTSATVSARMGSSEDANTSMNCAVGILNKAIIAAELQSKKSQFPQIGFEELLHSVVIQSSLELYANGHLREAVLNSITAVFDYLRLRTGSYADGDRLIGEVCALNDPILIFSELDSDSRRNDQKGFMQIFKGAYQGIRNPKAHSLTHKLNPQKAAQYLIFASLLARRIEEAKTTKV